MAEVEAIYAELDALTERIASSKRGEKQLYEERNRLFALLLEAGERQAVIARRAKVTSTAVGFAVGKTYKRETTR